MTKLEFTNKVIDNLNSSMALNGKINLEKFIDLTNKQYEDINYTRCSLHLPDEDKQKEIGENAYILNLQNLSGREDFEEAFRLGIETGVEETIEFLESKAIV